MNEIRNIPIDQLHPHPQNPRKDLGDLSELAASIKASGIYQNLTVVPGTYGYTVVIGHRRLAAAKLAGLTELPCIVRSMTEQEQIATMMLENMQRSDLTPIEEADGFQLMMDFGMDVDAIAAKTGISQSTIRRRTKLLKFDREKLLSAQKRGATLSDYAKLDEIADEKDRNEVLDAIGTKNFDWQYKKAMENQKTAEWKKKVRAEWGKFAREITSYPDWAKFTRVKYVYKPNVPDPEPDPEDGEYNFYISSYGAELYKVKSDDEISAEDAKQTARKKELAESTKRKKERIDELNAIAHRAWERRCEFVRTMTQTGPSALRAISEALVNYCEYDGPFLGYILGVEYDEDGETSLWEQVSAEYDTTAETSLYSILAATTLAILCDDGTRNAHYEFNGEYYENETIDNIYGFLAKLGYAPADEEMRYINGTHELFNQGQED